MLRNWPLRILFHAWNVPKQEGEKSGGLLVTIHRRFAQRSTLLIPGRQRVGALASCFLR